MSIKFGSLFSGIGGFDLGFERAGMECAWHVEIDLHCQKLLEKRFPNAKRYTDIREVGKHNLESVDVICGGFPCQDVSIAGKRAGLAGERSGLWTEFARVIDELEPCWVVVENVPGLLSSNRGRDFATIIQWLVKRGYGVSWRVLDAQHFGVAQRRRRVFIVASFGSGRCAQVLFERQGVSRDSAKSRKAQEGVAGTLKGGTGGRGYPDPSDGNGGGLTIGFDLAQITSKLNYSNPKPGDPQPPLNTFAQGMIAMHETGQGFWQEGERAGTIRAEGENRPSRPSNVIAYNIQHNDGGEHKRQDRPNGGLYVSETETALTVGSTDMTAIAFAPGNLMRRAGENPSSEVVGTPGAEKQGDMFPHIASQSTGVRRLTPTECERLQGFPDGYTEGQSDSTRYKQLGNAVAVPCAAWIGRQIMDLSQ